MDRGQRETEAILKQIEKRINQEYKQAIDEIEDQLSDYLRRFEIKDKKWQEWVESGYKTEDQYKKWRMQQMTVGEKWSEQKEQIAYELAHVNETAKGLAKMAAPEIFAENANYSTFKIEKDAKIDTGFTLYSRESVAELIANDPEVLPPVGKKVARDIAMGKAVKWNRQQLQSVMMQGILQGDSIPKLATRLANTVGDRDRKAAIRNARTMATAAQNAGREQSYKDAQAKGIEMEQMWIATLDNRTRHSHRWLDGERKPVGEPFSNGCRYPADPEGAPAEIYNCRCTLRAVVKGLERRSGLTRVTAEGQSYEQWKNEKAKSNPIDLPEQKSKAIKESYIREYMNGIMDMPDTMDNGVLDSISNAFVAIAESGSLAKQCDKYVKKESVKKLTSPLTTSQIIDKIGGKDSGAGSCASLAWAYLANEAGYDVNDFRGGTSRKLFASRALFKNFLDDNGIKYKMETTYNDAVGARKLLGVMEDGKEYVLRSGGHAAIVRSGANGYEYLELQTANHNGFKPLDINVLKQRFSCKEENRYLGIKYKKANILVDAESMKQSDAFKSMLGYINTNN